MYITSIRKTDHSIIEVAVSGDNVLSLANMLESSPTVLNFKVLGAEAMGLDQQAFGGGDYRKWVKKHH